MIPDYSFELKRGVIPIYFFFVAGIGVGGLVLITTAFSYDFIYMITTILLGLSMMLAGGLVFGMSRGIDLYTKDGLYREYLSLYGWKSGSWQKIGDFPDITVMLAQEGYMVHSRFGANSMKIDDRKAGVYLLSENHHKKFKLANCNSVEEAAELAKELSEKLSKKFTKYQPKVSARTLRNRRR